MQSDRKTSKRKKIRPFDPPESPHSVGIVQPRTVRLFTPDDPLLLESGKTLAPVDVAYEMYGELNAEKDNVIFVCHALSGSAHAAGWNSEKDSAPGWWDSMIGPGKPMNTSCYAVLCANFLGSCYGTTGPTSINPATGKPYNRDFPVITIEDMVKVHKRLTDHLGITSLACVIGGSMGGMQVLEWSIRYPEMCRSCAAIATAAAINAQAIAWDAIGRHAITNDPNYSGGEYLEAQRNPAKGLAIARMIGHITYLSDIGMTEKFGRMLRSNEKLAYDFQSEYAVETYLDHQGEKFVDRFDANTYLYITKAMDYYNLLGRFGSLNEAFKRVAARYLVVSFTSDWLFPAYQSKDIVKALMNNNKDVTYVDIRSDYGHDAFLVEWTLMDDVIRSFLGGVSAPNPNPGY